MPLYKKFALSGTSSRMWGVVAQAVRARAELRPLVRPLSYTLDMVEIAAVEGPQALCPYFAV